MMNVITSAHNEKLKLLGKLLQSAKHRREQGTTVLEGVHLLQAYLQSGYTPLQVFVPQQRCEQSDIRAMISQLPKSCVTLVDAGLLNKISQLNYADDIMTLIALPRSGSLKPQADCIVLENVQDTGNIGTILRSAAATGITEVILSKGCADVWSPKVLRAGMGAHFLLNVHERVHLDDWYAIYQGQILATALSEHQPYSLYDEKLNLLKTTAWIFGNEGAGVSAYALSHAHASVKIPMLGATESLNVAMAATVCVFEQMRQRFQAA